MNRFLLIICAMPILFGCEGEEPGSGSAEVVQRFGTVRSFILERDEVLLGEPVFIEYRVERFGPRSALEPVGMNYRGAGRDQNYYFELVHEDGTAARDPLLLPKGQSLGGFGDYLDVEEGKPYQDWIPLQKYCALDRAGKYTLRCENVKTDARTVLQLTVRTGMAQERERMRTEWIDKLENKDTPAARRQLIWSAMLYSRTNDFLPLVDRAIKGWTPRWEPVGGAYIWRPGLVSPELLRGLAIRSTPEALKLLKSLPGRDTFFATQYLQPDKFREMIPWLIEQLDIEEDERVMSAGSALRVLTGKRFMSREAWTTWWAANAEGHPVPTIGSSSWCRGWEWQPTEK